MDHLVARQQICMVYRRPPELGEASCRFQLGAIVDWIMLLIVSFLAPSAITVGSMLTAVSAGAADVLTTGRSESFRVGAVFSATCMAGALWSLPIVWISQTEAAPRVVATAVAVVAFIAAVTPVTAFALQTLRSRETARTLTAAVCLAAAVTVAGVLTALSMR